MKLHVVLITLFVLLSLQSCGRFQAKRLSLAESDEKALKMTDNWTQTDHKLIVEQIAQQITRHKGFQNYLKKRKTPPKLFIMDVKNDTSEPYFPISDLNDELLNELSMSGEYLLVDAAAREMLLKEIQYQHDGMVDPNDVKQIGKQAGADLLIFGTIHMKPIKSGGKTLKEYTVNVRMTDIEKGLEVLRTRAKSQKFSQK